MSDVMERYVQEAIRLRAARDEVVIRGLLGRWVSELDPAVAWQDGRIIGLTVADSDLGTSPFILRVR